MGTIRTARIADLAVLPRLERAAGEGFRELGMDAVADDEPPSVAELSTFQQAGRALVFPDEHDHPVGYLLVAPFDDHAYIEQVSVHPDHARQRIGQRLVHAAEAWARRQRLAGLTLTCYATVPWNAPYYQRLGFRVLSEQEMCAGLRAVRARETARGLDRWPRVAMLRRIHR